MECPRQLVIICVRDRHGGIFASNIRIEVLPENDTYQLDLKGALIACIRDYKSCISEILLTASLFLSLI